MVDYLKEYAESRYTDFEFQERCEKYTHARPFTKESLLYREIFERYYPGQAEMIADFWMPNKEWEGCNAVSYTHLDVYKRQAPGISVLIFITVRTTYSFSSSCMDVRRDFKGATKYLQIIGSSVISGIFRVGMISDCTISNRSFKNTSHSFLVALLSKNI